MNEQRERFERGLSECAKRVIPDDLDLWESIEAKVEEAPDPRRRNRFSGRTKLAFLAAGVVVFGMGAYGASGYAYDLFQSELPGIDAKVEGVEIGQSKTLDGATVDVEWAYADTEFVVVGYTVEDHLDNRIYSNNDAELWPVFFDERIGSPPLEEPHASITDGSGAKFYTVGGTTTIHEGIWPWPMPNPVVFEAPDGLRTGSRHDFRFEIPLKEEPVFKPGQGEVPYSEEPTVGPYVFDLNVPVKPASIVPVNQTVEANGIEMTLKEVVDSPARPQATVCMTSPQTEFSGSVQSRGTLDTRELENGCWIVGLDEPVHNGMAVVTITSLDGVFEGASNPDEYRETEGPWRFEVELP